MPRGKKETKLMENGVVKWFAWRSGDIPGFVHVNKSKTLKTPSPSFLYSLWRPDKTFDYHFFITQSSPQKKMGIIS